MKLLFENTTKHSKNIYDRFLNFHKHTYLFSYISYTFLVITFILFSIFLQIQYHNFSIIVLLFAGLVLFLIWRLFHPVFEINKEYKSDKIKKQKEYTFKFYDKYFTVQDKKELFEIRYFQLYKVFEVSDFFYLYIDKRHAFLLNKTTFKDNNPIEFSKFIKKKCWWFYRFR